MQIVVGGRLAVAGAREVRLRIALFALAAMVATFLPASGLVLEVGFVVAERVLYLPSMGFCLIAALAVWLAWEQAGSTRARAALVALVAIVVSCYAARSWTRNADWNNELTLFVAQSNNKQQKQQQQQQQQQQKQQQATTTTT